MPRAAVSGVGGLRAAQQSLFRKSGPGARTHDSLLTKAKVIGPVLSLSEHLSRVDGWIGREVGVSGCVDKLSLASF